MKRILYNAVFVLLLTAALFRVTPLSVAAVTEDAVMLIDGKQVSGYAEISKGTHTVTARSDAEIVCVAVYENDQFKAVSFGASLTYDFPDSGAEIALFCLDSEFRPLREAVCVKQGAVSGEEDAFPIADGVYSGSAHCLTGYINYTVSADVTVKDGVVTEIQDRTLKTPMSSNDKLLYSAAWRSVSKGIAKAKMKAEEFQSVDGVTGATVSTAGINAAVKNALQTQTVAREESGDLYAPEGISLYARAYPVVTVRNGKLYHIRIVPAKNTDTERLEAFAAEIVRRQSVTGLAWPVEIQGDAFAVANLTEQILYGTGVLK